MELRLDGKVALVTGGSRGIGLQIARVYAEAGAKLMITSRKAEACEKAAASIDGEVAWAPSNVGKLDDAERVIDATLDRFGALDILVNNAATNPYAGPAIDVDLPRWEKTISVNLTAPMFWTQLAWRRAMKKGGGVVINLSSVGGLATSPILGVYDVTKAALIHLTMQLAAELAPQVRVNAIAPGLIKTDFARVLWDEGRGEKVAKAYPLGRLGETQDIAGAALFLASESGSWITGQTLVLDGGGLVAFKTVA
ncbi:MAG: SDR family oxidoreductase [Myxococcales bacterium]|nr:SDR family oxidoreductase [Myxococcales bacterium]